MNTKRSFLWTNQDDGEDGMRLTIDCKYMCDREGQLILTAMRCQWILELHQQSSQYLDSTCCRSAPQRHVLIFQRHGLAARRHNGLLLRQYDSLADRVQLEVLVEDHSVEVYCKDSCKLGYLQEEDRKGFCRQGC